MKIVSILMNTVVHIIQAVIGTLCVFSVMGLVYFIPVILQVASLLAALAHPGHIVTYAPGDSLPCCRDVS